MGASAVSLASLACGRFTASLELGLLVSSWYNQPVPLMNMMSRERTVWTSPSEHGARDHGDGNRLVIAAPTSTIA